MREAIIGYITGIINNHLRETEGKDKVHSMYHKEFANELSDLLDFVEDQEGEPYSVAWNNIKAKELKKDTSDYWHANDKLFRENCELVEENKKLTAKIDEWGKTNSKLMQKNESIGRMCNSLFKEYKELRQTLKEVLPFLPQGCRDEVRKVLEGNK